MGYKVGDKVKIKDRRKLCSIYSVSDEMIGFGGRIATIVKLIGIDAYLIDLDSQKWHWNDDMIQELISNDESEEVKMRYKVGDKVLLKSRSEIACDFIANEEMPFWGGKIATIMELTDTDSYKIDLDGQRWYWTDDMIERLILKYKSEEEKAKYKVGDKVLLKSKEELENSVLDTVSEMIALGGKIATIMKSSGVRYRIDLDGQRCSWNDDMIERLILDDEFEEKEVNRLKIGDKVRIRRDLNLGKYGNDFVSGKMVDFKGKIATIKDIKQENDRTRYYIDLDERYYSWTQEMFEDVINNIKSVFSNIEEGETYISKDGKRIITLKDGFFLTQGFDETLSFDEEFELVTILSVQDVVKLENKGKKYKAIFKSEEDEDMIVTVEVYRGGSSIELEDEEGDDICDSVSLSSVLEANYIKINN